MDFDLSEEQRLLAATAERLAAARYGAGERKAYISERVGYSPETWRMMGEAGLLALPFAEDHGGLGGDVRDLACVAGALAREIIVEPFLYGAVLAGGVLERAGGPAQKDAWLPRLIAGETTLAFAHIEKRARFRIDHVETTCRLSGETGRLSGRKSFTPGAGGAGAFIVSAREPDADLSDINAVRLFLVDADAEGLTRKDYRLTDGSVASDIEFAGVEGALMPGGLADALPAIDRTRVIACAEMLSLMERLFDETLDYVKTRKQFGQPIGKFQVIQHRLADFYAALELSRAHLLRLTESNPSGADYAREVSGGKAFISRTAIDIAEGAVQLHGGMGVTDELIIGHGLKRLLVLASLFGDPDTELRRYANGAA